MGIDISGHMVIGVLGSEISDEVDLRSLVDNEDVEVFPLGYDAPTSHSVIGIGIDDIDATDINTEWITAVKRTALEVEELLGVKATLYGVACVT